MKIQIDDDDDDGDGSAIKSVSFLMTTAAGVAAPHRREFARKPHTTTIAICERNNKQYSNNVHVTRHNGFALVVYVCNEGVVCSSVQRDGRTRVLLRNIRRRVVCTITVV